ncbi:NAD(P)H-hydrate epimerase [Oligella urethralis]|uniref:NAD(P)H-hydrate epimerase n=1 Tax=Oligella urethralis TaxID=90245 RepID=UPI0025511676|nr:NAD(P)H-hydrate epimerase [Oligella urethralis]MDK6203176.1 NAD(P)H-hydrate epimerase [Oligella urethralis]
MKRIYTAAAMRLAEKQAVERGTSYEQLMENAGQAAAEDLLARLAAAKLTRPGSVFILCGKGNNGGDGLVIARALATAGLCVKILFVLGEDLSALAELNLKRLADLSTIKYLSIDEFSAELMNDSTAWIIDGVFGTGYSGDLPTSVASVMAVANQATAYRIALDVPSGLNCDSGVIAKDSFKADLCYTFGAYKPAHMMPQGKAMCGELVCLDIGIA